MHSNSGSSPALSEHAPPDREFTQKRFSTRTRFQLREDELRYELHTDNQSRTFTLSYAELSRDRETLTERNSWWRNVGVVWVLVGAFMAAADWMDSGALRVPIWVWLGAICLAVYQFRVTRFLIIPAERCNLLILDDAQRAAIVAALEARRAHQLRQRLDYISPNEHPEQQRQRMLWLQRQGVLDEHEISARMLQIDALVAAHEQARLQAQGPED
jgi:hypothetical protein